MKIEKAPLLLFWDKEASSKVGIKASLACSKEKRLLSSALPIMPMALEDHHQVFLLMLP